MVSHETSVGTDRGMQSRLQIGNYNEARVPIFNVGDLTTLTRVYLPAVLWEAQLVRWLAHAAHAAAHGDEALKQRFLDRCIDMVQANRDGRFAPFKWMH